MGVFCCCCFLFWFGLILNCLIYLYDLDINSLLDMLFANIFSHSVDSFFFFFGIIDGIFYCARTV